MCDFCLKHGEGRKWYLEAANYSEDLLADVRRRRFIESFATDLEGMTRDTARMEDLDRLPAVFRTLVRRWSGRRMRVYHFGQVVPIEDVVRIFELVNSVVRISCICRQVTLGREKRYCYGVSMGPNGGRFAEIIKGLDGSFYTGPDRAGVESVDKADALAAIRELEHEGLCHTVWTFVTPFIAGLCNCDRADCLALKASVGHRIPILFRAEYVASIDASACTGCRQCLRLCPFGALAYSAGTGRTEVDARQCFGCGICRAECAAAAIRLRDRREVPAAARLWTA